MLLLLCIGHCSATMKGSHIRSRPSVDDRRLSRNESFRPAVRLPALPPRPGAAPQSDSDDMDALLHPSPYAVKGRDVVDRLKRVFGASVITDELSTDIKERGDNAARAVEARTSLAALTEGADPLDPEVQQLERRMAGHQARIRAMLSGGTPPPRKKAPMPAALSLPVMPKAVTPAPRPTAGRAVVKSKRRVALDKRTAAAAAAEVQRQVTKRERDLYKVRVLEGQVQMFSDMAAEAQRRQRAVEEAGKMRRTGDTIIGEWTSELALHPLTQDDREQADIDRGERRFRRAMRGEEEGGDDGDDIAKAKTWRIPKNTSVEVFRDSRVSCFPLKVLHGERLVMELEKRQSNGMLWVLTDEGWIPAQLSCDGITKVQIVPEVRNVGKTVHDYMMDALDSVSVRVVGALEHCQPDRMKSERDVQDFNNNCLMQRRELRDLPTGHYTLMKQTWQSMQAASTVKSTLMMIDDP
jgi:hypothetical protein